MTTIIVILLAVLLVIAAVSDLKSRRIPNWLNGLIALCAPLLWWQQGLALWPDIAWQVGVAFLVFAGFAVLFYLRAMGGGDVKMMGALALSISTSLVMSFLMVTAILGGIVAAVMLVRKRMGHGPKVPQVPYGVAIAAAGLWVLHQQFFNQFALTT